MRMHLLTCLIVVSFSLHAQEELPQDRKVLSAAERVELQAKRTALREEALHKGEFPTEEGSPCRFNRELPEQVEGRKAALYEMHYYNLRSEARHWLNSVAFFGGSVTTEDGTKWGIANEDQFEVMSWWPSDIVYVTHAECPFCSHPYMLVNENRATVVYATRLTKPDSWLFTKRIALIDRFMDRIMLNDGTWWNVAWIDDLTLDRWLEGDLVIIGINNGYDKVLYPCTLINIGIDIFNIGADEYVGAQYIY